MISLQADIGNSKGGTRLVSASEIVAKALEISDGLKNDGDVPYRKNGGQLDGMDCSGFIEKCLRDCGENVNYNGSNDMFRHAVTWRGTIDEARANGYIVLGALCFIHDSNGGEPDCYKTDSLGNADVVGICVGDEVLWQSEKHKCFCQVPIPQHSMEDRGGWSHIALCKHIDYSEHGISSDSNAEGTSVPKPDRLLKVEKGDVGSMVRYLQQCLNMRGYSLDIDGDFGDATFEAVKDFQTSNGLETDGIVGTHTWELLV